MLFITGAPRSGTSALAKYCEMMGHDPGDAKRHTVVHQVPSFEDIFLHGAPSQGVPVRLGERECLELVDINRAIARVDAADPLVIERIKRYTRRVAKDPRFISLGTLAIIRTWWQHRPDMRLLVVRRDFRQVGQSLAKWPNIFGFSDNVDENAQKMEDYFHAFMNEVARLGVPNRQVCFPDLIHQFDYVYSILTGFGKLYLEPDSEAIFRNGLLSMGSNDCPKSIWNRWFDPGKVQHT